MKVVGSFILQINICKRVYSVKTAKYVRRLKSKKERMNYSWCQWYAGDTALQIAFRNIMI